MERSDERDLRETFGAAVTVEDLRETVVERQSLFESQREELKSLAHSISRLVDLTDPQNAGHSRRVSNYSYALGLELGLTSMDVECLRIGGCLHDIGKLHIRPGILNKATALTTDEYEEVRRHPNLGFELLRPFAWVYPVEEIARFHHERWDGSGYPFGYAGENIPFHARIVAVADVFDAMLSRRPYSEPRSLGDVMDELLSCAGVLFDKDVVMALLSRLGRMGFDIDQPVPEEGLTYLSGE